MSASRDIALGGSILAVGVVVTVGTLAVAEPGGSYVVAWGAIIFGALTLGRGLMAAGTDDDEPDEGVPTPAEVAATNARLISGSISDDDYPASAIRSEAEGRCVVGFTVNEAGRVCDVDLVESSGHASLDAAACKLIRTRFRFEPARDFEGLAIAQRRSQAIVWRLPEDDQDDLPAVPESFDDVPPPLDENRWHVLSSRTESMEVFRMTDEDRTVMDLVRLSGNTIEMCRNALDGPSWIHSPPPPMGLTEDGIALWEPEETATTDLALVNLPEWAEKHRPRIIDYLRSQGVVPVSDESRPPMPEGAEAFDFWFRLEPDDTIAGPFDSGSLQAAFARGYFWLGRDARFYGARQAKAPDTKAIGYVCVVVGYWYGNTGDPRERQTERTGLLRSFPVDFPQLDLPDDCWETERRCYAIYAPAVSWADVVELASAKDWDQD